MTAGMDDEARLHGLIGVAFAHGEPALPDVDAVLGEIEVLGARIKRRQRVRTGIGAAVLCATAFGTVAAIDTIARSHGSSQQDYYVPGTGAGDGTDAPAGTGAGNTSP